MNIICIYIHYIFIHSSIVGYLGCFHNLVVSTNAAMNIGRHTSFLISVLVSLDKYPRVEAKSNSGSIFNFLS